MTFLFLVSFSFNSESFLSKRNFKKDYKLRMSHFRYYVNFWSSIFFSFPFKTLLKAEISL
nr:MAG TPA: hypothetical protein [Caudoviricetes sp.]